MTKEYKYNLNITVRAHCKGDIQTLLKKVHEVNGSFYMNAGGQLGILDVRETSSDPRIIEKMKNWKSIPTLPGVIHDIDTDPNQILAKAFDELTDVVISGKDKEGEYYFASSVADGADILWYLRKCEQKLLEIVD